jgi:NitT/TauT family transport system substrate-binding protein
VNLHRLGQHVQRWARQSLLPLGLALSALGTAGTAGAEALKVGYSDWPGWVAWQVALDKGWFKEAGLDVKFEWFDYSASMDAFAAGKLDVVGMTNGDTLVTGSGGGKGIMVLITDYSSGNDMILGKPGIKSMKDLKGKKVAVEVGLVDHLLLVNALKKAGMKETDVTLVNALKKAGMKETDVTLVNAKTNELPQVFAAGDVAAIGVWQPVAGQAMKAVPGAKALYTSADEPGLIYDVFVATPAVAKNRKADLAKFMKVWDRVVAYVQDPKTQPDAVKIMAARSGVTPAEYLPYLKGTHLLNLADGKKVYAKGKGFGSIQGSTAFVDAFNVANGVYKAPEKVDSYLDYTVYGAP